MKMSEGSGFQGNSDFAKSNSEREVVSVARRGSSKAVRGTIHRRSGLNAYRSNAAEQEDLSLIHI